MKNTTLHIGIIGAGGFAQFAANAFATVVNIKIAGIYDLDKTAAAKLAAIFNVQVFDSYDELLDAEHIDLVYIATPPFLHYEQSRKGLLAGKHVICEKPAALSSSDAEELRDISVSQNLLYVVNLMQRYNPLYSRVGEIIEQELLGKFLHGYFENYASDEFLDAGHWFWDEQKSGGIFIEHGVHFFDMFSGWFGKGEVLNAIAMNRPGVTAKIIDRVQVSVLYSDAIVNMYHGFDQPKILDRQEMKLQFERGDITLYEWVPVKMKVYGIVTKEQLKVLENLSGDIEIRKINEDMQQHPVKGRFKTTNYDYRIIAEAGSGTHKQERYEEILIAMISDQLAWINNRDHQRRIDANNAVESVRLAERATNLSKNIVLKPDK